MSKKDVQVNFRMPETLKAELEIASKANNRSLTAEIVSRLETSLTSNNQTTSETPDAVQLEAMVESAAKAAAKEAAKEVAELLRGRLESLDIKVQRGIDGRIKNRDTELKRRKGE